MEFVNTVRSTEFLSGYKLSQTGEGVRVVLPWVGDVLGRGCRSQLYFRLLILVIAAIFQKDGIRNEPMLNCSPISEASACVLSARTCTVAPVNTVPMLGSATNH